jgi:hypothetical protein
LRNQGIQIGLLAGIERIPILKQQPAQALQIGIGLLLDTPGLVEGARSMG